MKSFRLFVLAAALLSLCMVSCSDDDAMKKYSCVLLMNTMDNDADTDDEYLEAVMNEMDLLEGAFSSAFGIGTDQQTFTFAAESEKELQEKVDAVCRTVEDAMSSRTWQACHEISVFQESDASGRICLYDNAFGDPQPPKASYDGTWSSGNRYKKFELMTPYSGSLLYGNTLYGKKHFIKGFKTTKWNPKYNEVEHYTVALRSDLNKGCGLGSDYIYLAAQIYEYDGLANRTIKDIICVKGGNNRRVKIGERIYQKLTENLNSGTDGPALFLYCTFDASENEDQALKCYDVIAYYTYDNGRQANDAINKEETNFNGKKLTKTVPLYDGKTFQQISPVADFNYGTKGVHISIDAYYSQNRPL